MQAVAPSPLYYAAPPAGAAPYPYASNVATVAAAPSPLSFYPGAPLPMQQQSVKTEVRENTYDTAMGFAELGTSFIPVVGTGVSTGLGVLNNKRHGKREKEALLERFRDDVADKMRMNPENVTIETLQVAAQRYPGTFRALKQELEDTESRATGSIGKGIFSTVAGLGTTAALGPIGGIAGSFAADAVYDKVVGQTKEKRTAHDALSELEDSLNGQGGLAGPQNPGGAYVTPADIFDYEVARDERLGRQIKERYGKEYHELDDAAQLEIMNKAPDLLMQSHYIASQVNSGRVSLAALERGDFYHALCEEFNTPQHRVLTNGVQLAPMLVRQAPPQLFGSAGYRGQLMQERADTTIVI